MIYETNAIKLIFYIELPEVVSIKPSGSASLLTTRSWDYLGVGLGNEHSQPLGLLQKANFGEDVIIGVVDSGK